MISLTLWQFVLYLIFCPLIYTALGQLRVKSFPLSFDNHHAKLASSYEEQKFMLPTDQHNTVGISLAFHTFLHKLKQWIANEIVADDPWDETFLQDMSESGVEDLPQDRSPKQR